MTRSAVVTFCVERISMELILLDLDVVEDSGAQGRQSLLLSFVWLGTAESVGCLLADGWG